MRLIANARSEKGMTQKELAAACGLKQSNISRLECGTTSPTLKTLEQLAAGLGKKLRISFNELSRAEPTYSLSNAVIKD